MSRLVCIAEIRYFTFLEYEHLELLAAQLSYVESLEDQRDVGKNTAISQNRDPNVDPKIL